VFCGKDYTIALDEDGKIYSFGNGKTGVLGQASVKKLNQPELVEALADKRVVSVSAGWSHVACQVVDE
jgi:alpha-tubulin suppressor-like RCC1 family protein